MRNEVDRPISNKRLQLMEKAIELAVDKSDFHFRTQAEQRVWDDLERELLDRQTKLGAVWIAA